MVKADAMSASTLEILLVTASANPRWPQEDGGWGPFNVEHCAESAAAERLAAQPRDAVVFVSAAFATSAATASAGNAALLWIHDGASVDEVLHALANGVQDVLHGDEFGLATWPARLRAAIERQRLLTETRQAYATDVLTGLPHEQQLIEHMSHLLALREREPSPMALLVLRVEGLSATQSRLGSEAASVLRRKLAVRVRAGLRASDVVASIAGDAFAVLLSSIEAPGDAELVAAKLLASLNDTFMISGQQVPVATALGVASYPGDGTQPQALLRRAVSLAAQARAVGRMVQQEAAND